LRWFSSIALPMWLALLSGNLIIPLTYLSVMTGGKLSAAWDAPWWFLAAIFLGGMLFSFAYFRRRT
jgi:RsiW-degrading membrane proteinase PrsW (M82 family)